MLEKPSGNEFRTTVICIDAYGDDRFQGRICNPYLSGAENFQSLMQMLLKLDCLLDKMQFPQSFTANREFRRVDAALIAGGSEMGEPVGKLATFAVRILFRQNTSWQGSVIWLEENREESFRSALELLLLMHSALSPKSDT